MHLFGKCTGLAYLSAGLLSLLQYALFTWVTKGGNFPLVRRILV